MAVTTRVEADVAAELIARATDIARSMVTRYGMVDRVGHVVYQREPTSFLGVADTGMAARLYSEETARAIDCAVRDVAGPAFERARATLTNCRDVLAEGARRLMARETLDEATLAPLFGRVRGARAPMVAAMAAGGSR